MASRVRKRIVQTQQELTPELPQLPLERMFKDFISVKKTEGRSKRTLKDYDDHFRFFTKWLMMNEKGNETITKALIREYVAYMVEKYSPVTVNIRLATLKVMFKFLYDEGYLKINPLEGVHFVRAYEKDLEAFTLDEVQRILKQPNRSTYVGYRNYCLLLLLLDTGCRISETLALTQDDFDFVLRQVRLKGENTKTRRTRIVPLSRETAKAVQVLIHEVNQHFETNLVFVTHEGNPCRYYAIYREIKEYGKAASVEKRVSPHTFRHTFAKMMIKSGTDPFTLQRILGHSRLDMVKKYINMNIDDIREEHMEHSPITKILK